MGGRESLFAGVGGAVVVVVEVNELLLRRGMGFDLSVLKSRLGEDANIIADPLSDDFGGAGEAITLAKEMLQCDLIAVVLEAFRNSLFPCGDLRVQVAGLCLEEDERLNLICNVVVIMNRFWKIT